MMLVPSGVRVHIALGVTDMRKGLDGLAMLVQGVLEQDPFSGHLFAFRGRKANLIKIVFWDGTGLCLFTKRLEEGRFSIGPDEHLVEVSKFMYRCSRNLELGAPVFDIRMHIDQDGLAAGVETLCLL